MLSREEASLFYRTLVRRYERGSLSVTSNNGFADWGDVFNDPVLATAILDRLQYDATTLTIYGGELSTAGKKEGRDLRQSTGRRILDAATDVAS